MIKQVIYTDRSNDLLVRYMHDINKYPILSNEEINNLIPLAKNGDAKAIDKICKSVLRFGITIAKQYQNKGVPLMDLISESSFGILEAIKHFDVSRGNTFSAYAVWWMRQKIFIALYETGRLMRIPNSQHVMFSKILQFMTKYLKENQFEPSIELISEGTGLKEKEIKTVLNSFVFPVSLDTPVGEDEDTSLYEITPSDTRDIELDANQSYITKEILKIINQLSARERDVIKLYYGIEVNPVDLHYIATLFGLCDERARQLKEKALSKLRHRFKKELIQYLPELIDNSL